MDFIVEMVRDNNEAGGRDRFSCSSVAWDLLLQVGQSFGWRPLGSTYLPTRARETPQDAARHDYRPGNRKDYKRIDAEDALAWAQALSRAHESTHLAAMLGESPRAVILETTATHAQRQSANAPFLVVMEEFIEYAYGGAFAFARAD